MDRDKQEIARLTEEIERLEGDIKNFKAGLPEDAKARKVRPDHADVTIWCIEESIAALKSRIANLEARQPRQRRLQLELQPKEKA